MGLCSLFRSLSAESQYCQAILIYTRDQTNPDVIKLSICHNTLSSTPASCYTLLGMATLRAHHRMVCEKPIP
ncbi:hypothetical protein BDB01DRAFT_791385 [Pilobolus umbonatus]|nr:hypothetical protein BDB01DRAFT_791385 [Pilobolus umbonatus]